MVTNSCTSKVAVLGGDRREIWIIKAFLDAGWAVASFGAVDEAEAATTRAPSLVQAVTGARLIVTPAPGMSEDGALYAPHAAGPLRLSQELLERTAPDAHLFGGTIQPWLQEAARRAGVTVHEFADDDRLQVLHAIPTAEGAIAETVRNSDATINGSTALVIGYGRIAVILSRILRAIGADTTVAARRPEVRARAQGEGHRVCGTDPNSLIRAGARAELVYTTAPARLVTDEVLAVLRPTVLLMDLASPPGGIDREAAAKSGLKVVWARGQAVTAPAHSGRAQFEYIANVLAETSHRVPVEVSRVW